MNPYIEANRHAWNIRLEAHKNSEFYDVEGWKKGKTSLTDIELRELGDVSGKNLLHLQCHFGQDTLSWARLGARVTGCDLSDEAIAYARQLAREVNLKAHFVCCNVYDLPQHLKGKFDIVFTSFGVVGWLPDLEPWAAVIAHFLKKGGKFYIADFHPVVWMLDDKMEFIKYAYHNAGVIETEMTGTYAERYADLKYTEYGWNHSLSEILNALLGHGLRLEFFNEHMYSPFNCFDKTVLGPDGNYRIQGLEDMIPMVYSLRAIKQ
ncbi:MAG: class I SAM-dependent methyltransferase [Saprospiraceae bacterium]